MSARPFPSLFSQTAERCRSDHRPLLQHLEERRLLDSSLPIIGESPAASASSAVSDSQSDSPDPRAAQGEEIDIVLGDINARRLLFTDSVGTRVSILHRVGTATIHLTGDDLQQTTGRRDVELSGGNIRIVSITYADTSFHSRTIIRTSGTGDGVTSLETITGNGPVGKLLAPTTSLTGAGIVMTGTGVIASITLADLENGADIVMPGNGPPRGINLHFDLINAGTDISLVSDIRSLKADSWLDGTLTATQARSINISGNVSGDWSLTTGGARSITLGGSVLSGTWDFTGTLRRLNARRDFAADLTATSYRVIKIGGDFTGSITATAGGGRVIRKMTVNGSTEDAAVATVGDIHKLIFHEITNLSIYAGAPQPVPGDWINGLPSTTGDLVRDSVVDSLIVRGSATGATFVAQTFKRISMQDINSGDTFHMAAQNVRNASMRIDNQRYKFRNNQIFAEAPDLPYLDFNQLA